MIGSVDDPGLFLLGCPRSLPSAATVRGTIVFYGFFDFAEVEDYSDYPDFRILQAYWGATYDELLPEVIEEMSPQSRVDASDPAFVLIHGADDGQMPVVMTERFAATLEQAGVEVELLLIEGAGNGFERDLLDRPEMSRSLEAVQIFPADK